MADVALRPLRNWVDLEPQVAQLSPPEQAQAKQDYLHAIQSRVQAGRDDLLPQDPSGQIPARHFARAQLLGNYVRHPDTGEIVVKPAAVHERGAVESMLHGARHAPIVQELMGPADDSVPSEPDGSMATVAEGLGAAVPSTVGMAGAGVAGLLTGGPRGAARAMRGAAPVIFGTEAGLGEKQREQAAGEEIQPGRIGKHAVGGAVVGALPMGKVSGPVGALLDTAEMNPTVRNVGARSAEALLEAGGYGAANATAGAAAEGHTPTLGEVGENVSQMAPLTSVMHAPNLAGGGTPETALPQPGERPPVAPEGLIAPQQGPGVRRAPASLLSDVDALAAGRGRTLSPVEGGPVAGGMRPGMDLPTDIPDGAGQRPYVATPGQPDVSQVQRAPITPDEAQQGADLAGETGDVGTARALRQRGGELQGAENRRMVDSLLTPGPVDGVPPPELTPQQAAQRSQVAQRGRPGGPLRDMMAARDRRQAATAPEPPVEQLMPRVGPSVHGMLDEPMIGEHAGPRPQAPEEPFAFESPDRAPRPPSTLDPVMPRSDPGFRGRDAQQADVTAGLNDIEQRGHINDLLDQQVPPDRGPSAFPPQEPPGPRRIPRDTGAPPPELTFMEDHQPPETVVPPEIPREPPRGKVQPPVAAEPRAAGEEPQGVPPEVEAVAAGRAKAWIRPPESEGTIPTKGEQAMHDVDLAAYAKANRVGYYVGKDGTEVLYRPEKIGRKQLQALDAEGKLAEIVNGPGTAPKPEVPTHMAVVRDQSGQEVRTVLAPDLSTAQRAAAHQPPDLATTIEPATEPAMQAVLRDRGQRREDLLDSLAELDDRIAWGTNAKGEPLGGEMVSSLKVQRDRTIQQIRDLGPDHPEPPTMGQGKIPVRKTTTLGMFGGHEGMEFGQVKTEVEDPAVNRVFAPPDKGRLPLRDRLRQLSHKVQSTVGEYLGFQTDLRLAGDNELRHARRKFMETERQARTRTQADLEHILNGLNEKAGEVAQFERVVELQNFKGRLQRANLAGDGEFEALAPGGLTLDQVDQALMELEPAMTPAVATALENHRALMRRIAEDQIAIKALPEAVRETVTYYPHVLSNWMETLSRLQPEGGTKPLKKAGRPWSQRSYNSDQSIDTDYLGVMERHLRSVYRANAVDEFARTWLPARDIYATLSPEERVAMLGRDVRGEPREPGHHGEAIEWQGKPYRVFRYAPFSSLGSEGDAGYLPNSEPEAIVLRQAARAGGPAFVVPEYVYDNFERFSTRERVTQMEAAWHRHTQKHKVVLLDMLGTKFQWMNFVGDNLNSLRYSTRGTVFSYVHLPEILKAISGKHPDREFQQLLSDQGVLGSSFFGSELPALRPHEAEGAEAGRGPRLEKLNRGNDGGVWQSMMGPVRKFFETREAHLRVGQALWNYRRWKANKAVWDGGYDISGLSAPDAIGEVATRFAVDYTRVSPKMKGWRTGLAPFATWFLQQAPDWGMYAIRRPFRTAAKMTPFAMMWAWNSGYASSSAYRFAAKQLGGNPNWRPEEVEDRHPDWLQSSPFHLNLPPGADGKDRWLQYNTGMDVALQVFQLDRILPMLNEWRAGRLKPREAFDQMLQDAYRKPIRFLSSVAGAATTRLGGMVEQQVPIFSAFHAAVTGVDPTTHRPIMPRRVEGTDDAALYTAWHFVNRVIFPEASVASRYLEEARMEEGSPFSDWLRSHGMPDVPADVIDGLIKPFDPRRTFGVGSAAPETREASKQLEDSRDLNVGRRNELSDIEDAFVEGTAQDNPDLFSQALDDAMTRGADLSSEDIRYRLKSPEVWQRIAQRRAQLATSPAARKDALEEQQQWRGVQQGQSFKHLPKSVRGAVLEGRE